jgi:hypothetical protein
MCASMGSTVLVRRDARRFLWRRWRDDFLLMTSMRVRRIGVNILVAYGRRWDDFLILGRQKLLTIIGSGGVLALRHGLLRLAARTSECSGDEGKCRP